MSPTDDGKLIPGPEHALSDEELCALALGSGWWPYYY